MAEQLQAPQWAGWAEEDEEEEEADKIWLQGIQVLS